MLAGGRMASIRGRADKKLIKYYIWKKKNFIIYRD